MNNKEKYKNTIDKIEIRSEVVQKAIENCKSYENERMLKNMKKENKIRTIRQAIVTIATLLGVTAASYASYISITGNTVFKKSTVQLEGEEYVEDTVQHNAVENNGIWYTIKTPDGAVMERVGSSDVYKNESSDSENTYDIPDMYMQVDVIDADKIEIETEKIKNEMKKYFKYDYETVDYYTEDKKVGIDGYNAKRYTITKGTNWNSVVEQVYVIKINENKAMIIRNVYFMEATEGWGDLVNQLIINTLEVVDN